MVWKSCVYLRARRYGLRACRARKISCVVPLLDWEGRPSFIGSTEVFSTNTGSFFVSPFGLGSNLTSPNDVASSNTLTSEEFDELNGREQLYVRKYTHFRRIWWIERQGTILLPKHIMEIVMKRQHISYFRSCQIWSASVAEYESSINEHQSPCWSLRR